VSLLSRAIPKNGDRSPKRATNIKITPTPLGD
jgi:hypothetical protein